MNTDKLKERLDSLEEEIAKVKEELKDKEGIWRPKDDVRYWFVNTFGDVDWNKWTNDDIDKFRLSQGNVFKTEKEAEQHQAHLKAVGKIRLAANGWKPDWKDKEQEKWYIEWNHHCNVVSIDYNKLFETLSIKFPTKDLAQSTWDSLTKQEQKDYFKLWN